MMYTVLSKRNTAVTNDINYTCDFPALTNLNERSLRGLSQQLHLPSVSQGPKIGFH